MSELLCKICGLTRPDDVALCNALGVDFTGFIFVRKSPRYIEAKAAAALPGGAAARVGVFAGASVEEVRDVARVARLDFIQLHGGEDPDFCKAVGPDRVIKVLWPERLAASLPTTLSGEEARAAAAKSLAEECERFASACAYFLLDAGQSGGGSGKTMDLAGYFAGSLAQGLPKPWLLAGGLGPQNIPAMLRSFAPHTRPDGLDLNSALEIAPGRKDPDRLREAVALTQGSAV